MNVTLSNDGGMQVIDCQNRFVELRGVVSKHLSISNPWGCIHEWQTQQNQKE
jgi:hypothetical protein